MNISTSVSALIVVVALTACSATNAQNEVEVTQMTSASPSASSTPTPVPSVTITPSVSPTVQTDQVPGYCVKASSKLKREIASLAQNGTGLQPILGYLFRSPDYSQVYFVALEFSATGIENQIGVWVTNDINGAGMIMSVDGLAKQFTDWFHSDESDAAISILDPSVDKVLGCFN
jgi:hypothetical protein